MKKRSLAVTTSLVLGGAFLIAIGSNAISPQPAQAITWEEVGKLFGVWQRYAEDINKTMNQPSVPTQTAPENPPEASSDAPSEEPELTE